MRTSWSDSEQGQLVFRCALLESRWERDLRLCDVSFFVVSLRRLGMRARFVVCKEFGRIKFKRSGMREPSICRSYLQRFSLQRKRKVGACVCVFNERAGVAACRT